MHLEKIELAFARDAFGRHSSTRTDVWVLNAHQTIIHPITYTSISSAARDERTKDAFGTL